MESYKVGGFIMKKVFLCTLAFLPVCAFAEDNDNWRAYLRADAGVTYVDINVQDYDLGGFQGMFNFAAGGQKGRWRAELAFQERATVSELFSSLLTQTMASLEQRALLVNGFYDVLASKHFAWYVGGGAGVNNYESIVSYQNTGVENTEKGFSAILGAYTGLSINFEHVGFDLGVDYFYTFKPSVNALVPKIGMRIIF